MTITNDQLEIINDSSFKTDQAINSLNMINSFRWDISKAGQLDEMLNIVIQDLMIIRNQLENVVTEIDDQL